MRTLPNNIVDDLLRHIPIILDWSQRDGKCTDTRVANAIRITRKHLQRLKRIKDNDKGQQFVRD